jgi:hypothetical protein
MSRAMHASRLDSITDAKGAARDWRTELVDALAARQSESGSWKNGTPRWEEASEELATIYSVLALQEAIKPRVTME